MARLTAGSLARNGDPRAIPPGGPSCVRVRSPPIGPDERAPASQWEARMSELVHYEAGDQVVTLTLDSPHNRNALSRQLVAELTGRLAEAAAEPSARAIVITHTGRGFCAGADLAGGGG